jgi:selenophosphate synthase
MKTWRKICFVVAVLLPLGNSYLQAPAFAHVLVEALTFGLALTLLATMDRKVFKQPIGLDYWQEMAVVIVVMVAGVGLFGHLGLMTWRGA